MNQQNLRRLLCLVGLHEYGPWAILTLRSTRNLRLETEVSICQHCDHERRRAPRD